MKHCPQLFTLLCFLFLNAAPSPQQAFRPSKDFALFFAVNNYAAWDKLKNPIAEAEAIAKDLRDLYDFQTEVVRDPSKAEIQTKIEEYRKKTYADDAQLFIFFTGHGEYLENTKEGFFIPKDAMRSDASQDSYLSYLRLQRWIETLPCRHILLCIDACFSGTFDDDIALKGGPGKRPGETSDWREQYIRQSLQYRSRLFMASGAKVRTPDKSAFATQFLLALRSFGGDDRLINATELWSYVQRASPKPCAARFGDHEAGGDFLFVMKDDAKTSAASADLADWNEAKSLNTLEAYQKYLKKHPKSDFTAAANGKIAALRAAVQSGNMVLVRGGTFQMGHNGYRDEEEPVHSVAVNDFYLSKYEVTVAEFRAFAEAANYQTDAERRGYSMSFEDEDFVEKTGVNWRHGPDGNAAADNHPVVNVSWNDATAYCDWLSTHTGKKYRLPTEAEWEYAAGNGSRHTKYSWGNDKPSGKKGGNVADETGAKKFNWSLYGEDLFKNYHDGYATTAPVGSFDPNDFGLYDMTGNVVEWCSDWFGEDYYKSSPLSNPSGPSFKSNDKGRAGRGGSWKDDQYESRVAFRDDAEQGDSGVVVGFRIAMTK